MATALPMPPPDQRSPLSDVVLGYIPPQSQDFYARRLTLPDIDYNDTRYPSLASPKLTSPSTPSTSTALPYTNRLEQSPTNDMTRTPWLDYSQQSATYSPNRWLSQKITKDPQEQISIRQSHQHPSSDPLITQDQSSPNPTSLFNQPPRNTSPYAINDHQDRFQSLPPLNNGPPPELAAIVADFPSTPQQSFNMGQRPSGPPDVSRDRPSSIPTSTPRHPSLPLAGVGQPASSSLSPIVPLSAGPSFNPASVAIPISPKPRAYAQQPTFINKPSAQPSFAPPQVPKEEVCVECAMRDQDMADVDVTSPGIWERESDALYEDLLRREEEEEFAGLPPMENASRPRARGGLLTEGNLRLWLSVNPKEPSSRQQTLDQYVKAQRSLLEAEALAHTRALRESRMLDDKMRDTYSQLRRSAYELGSSAQPIDDTGGVRIKPPHSPAVPSHLGTGHSRDVTLLENGMIVEHVDVRKEEREERDRKRKEEKREKSRARKSSRSSRSGADVMSVYSMQTPPPHPTDSGFFSGQPSGQRPDSRYSQSMSARPSSILTTGGERPPMLRAQSQASFSDMQSLGEASSPRRSRFFGFKNLSASWRSQESFAPSGSMIDMHVALQRERDLQYLQMQQQPAVDIGSNAPTLRIGETWPAMNQNAEQPAPTPEESRSTKKAKGLKKIWRIVTGSSSKGNNTTNGRNRVRSLERNDDDQPLAPPPPLSYLVSRETGVSSRRHVSTPSLPSTASNAFSTYAPSPPTAPSSLLPSPTSSRPSGPEKETVNEGFKLTSGHVGVELEDRMPSSDSQLQDNDLRGRTTRSSSRTLSSMNGPLTPVTTPSQRPMSSVLRRDKSLPPLPPESSVEFPNHLTPDVRPQTVFTYDPRGMPTSMNDTLAPPQAAFRTAEARRQSFGGVGSGPHLAARSLPARGAFARGQLNVPPFLAEEQYAEFGVSRGSLGQWPNAQQSQRSLQIPVEQFAKKRKSKFGLASLFGKKSTSQAMEQQPQQQQQNGVSPCGGESSLEYSGLRSSHSHSRYDTNMSGYASPMSVGSGNLPRQSIASHRNIELVDQDRDFFAYRYPSTDQRLDLVR